MVILIFFRDPSVLITRYWWVLRPRSPCRVQPEVHQLPRRLWVCMWNWVLPSEQHQVPWWDPVGEEEYPHFMLYYKLVLYTLNPSSGLVLCYTITWCCFLGLFYWDILKGLMWKVLLLWLPFYSDLRGWLGSLSHIKFDVPDVSLVFDVSTSFVIPVVSRYRWMPHVPEQLCRAGQMCEHTRDVWVSLSYGLQIQLPLQNLLWWACSFHPATGGREKPQLHLIKTSHLVKTRPHVQYM